MISYQDEVEALNNELTRTKGTLTIRGGLADDDKFREQMGILFRHNYSFTPPVRDGQEWILTAWHCGHIEPEDILPVFRVFGLILVIIILGVVWLKI